MPEHQFPSEGQALSGPFKVPSDVLKKQYFFGNRTSDLVIELPKINILGQKMSFSSENSSTQVKEKRKPTVSKNSKPKQQVIFYLLINLLVSLMYK